MLIDDFKSRYTSIPFATYTRDYKGNASHRDIDTLFHMHKEIEVMLVLEGSAKVYVDTHSFDIEKGDIVFLSPYILHRYTIPAHSDFKHYCLCFGTDLIFDKDLQSGLDRKTVHGASIIKSAESYAGYIEAAFQADAEKAPGWELRVIGNLSLFFAALTEAGHLSAAATPSASPVYYQMFDFIANHFGSNITSAQAAKALHMNHSYFCRVFRKNSGYCFENYLCMYRLERAKSLLKNTQMSVSEIALEVGFNSFSYFSKVFKKYNFMTPSQYRKR